MVPIVKSQIQWFLEILTSLKRVLVVQTILCIAIGVWFVGIENILPWNSHWLLPTPNRLDHAVAQLNWEFFRNAPLLQWPPVLIPNLGSGWGTVYVPFSSGSLFGIILKYFDQILPNNFQFLGAWLVFSFAMLGYWSVRLVSRLTTQPLLLWLGSTLFVVSPTIFYRIGVLGHFELSAHWLIFAAMWLYLAVNFSGRHWALLCTVTLIVNVYLFAMIFGIFVASIVKHLVLGSEWKGTLKKATILVGIFVFELSVFGFLEYRENAQGLGFFRSNSLSFLYPNFALGGSASGSFSRLLDWTEIFLNRPFIAFEREGFNFLGTGIILGLVATSFICALRIRQIRRKQVLSVVPLFALGVLFFLNSTSNQVAFGRREIMHFFVPSIVLDARQIFRTAERFVWPLAYCLVFFVVASIIYLIRSTRVSVAILGILLAVQIVDSSSGIVQSRRVLHQQSSISVLDDADWGVVLSGRTKIEFVPTFDYIADSQSTEVEAWLENSRFFPLLKLAASKNLSTNFSVTGRPVTELVKSENQKLETLLQSERLEESSIYVFATRGTWEVWRMQLEDVANFAVLDGYYILYSKP